MKTAHEMAILAGTTLSAAGVAAILSGLPGLSRLETRFTRAGVAVFVSAVDEQAAKVALGSVRGQVPIISAHVRAGDGTLYSVVIEGEAVRVDEAISKAACSRCEYVVTPGYLAEYCRAQVTPCGELEAADIARTAVSLGALALVVPTSWLPSPSARSFIAFASFSDRPGALDRVREAVEAEGFRVTRAWPQVGERFAVLIELAASTGEAALEALSRLLPDRDSLLLLT